MNYIPAGSEADARFYAYCALDAQVAFVNNSSVCIAGNPLWALRFEYNNIPIIGDNVKSLFPFRDTFKSAAITIDYIRCAKLAINCYRGGVLLEPSAYFSKNHTLKETFIMIERFINDMEFLCVHELPDDSRKRRKKLL